MNKKMRQKLLASVATGVTFAMYWSVPADVFAAEQEVTEDLGEVVVTATRSQKKDVDVPAATEIITAEEIKDSGAQDAGEALSKVDGIAYGAFGQNGAAMGTMDNSVNIRASIMVRWFSSMAIQFPGAANMTCLPFLLTALSASKS